MNDSRVLSTFGFLCLLSMYFYIFTYFHICIHIYKKTLYVLGLLSAACPDHHVLFLGSFQLLIRLVGDSPGAGNLAPSWPPALAGAALLSVLVSVLSFTLVLPKPHGSMRSLSDLSGGLAWGPGTSQIDLGNSTRRASQNMQKNTI